MVTASSEWMVDPGIGLRTTNRLTAVDRSIAPRAIHRPRRFFGDALPSELQPTAEAIVAMKLADDDGMLGPSQVRAAIRDPRTTAYGRQAFQELYDEMETLASRAPTAMVARVEVPRPGSNTTLLHQEGAIELAIQTRLKIVERREQPAVIDGDPHRALITELAINRQTSIELTVAEANQVIMVSQCSGNEIAFGPGTSTVVAAPGPYRLEVWESDNLVDVQMLTLPVLPRREVVEIDAFAGYQFIADGRPLHRVPVTGLRQPRTLGTAYAAAFSYEPHADHAPLEHEIAEAVRSAPVGLPAGRYRVRGFGPSDVWLDLAPTGAVRALVGKRAHALSPRINGDYVAETAGLVYTPSLRRLQLVRPGLPAVARVLTPFDRIG